MSIKIHHGAPGSYKTSGAVADDFVQAVCDGRYIVTNVRGLSDPDLIREILEEQGKTVPDSFQLLHLDTDENDNMEMLRRFWHWARDGAFFLLDEIQLIYPKSYRDTHLKKLDYPDGQDAADAAGRFLTIQQAFQQHRHRNWDFVVTTPNIKLVHDVLRSCAEGAYKHKNQAVLGAIGKGKYLESFHMADTNGMSARDMYTTNTKRIPKYVFKLYKSTATGKVTDTQAGTSLFKNTKVLLLLGVLLLCIVWIVSNGMPHFISAAAPAKPKEANNTATQTATEAAKPSTQTTTPSPQATPQTPQKNTYSITNGVVQTNTNGANNLATSSPAALPNRLNFLDKAESLYINSYIEWIDGKTYYKININLPNNQHAVIDEKAVQKLGLTFNLYSQCFGGLSYGDREWTVYCKPDDEPQKGIIDYYHEATTLAGTTPPAPQLVEAGRGSTLAATH